jgi:hypothetical protein
VVSTQQSQGPFFSYFYAATARLPSARGAGRSYNGRRGGAKGHGRPEAGNLAGAGPGG